eukprot:jgi/Tetstr1/454537/TSEL_041434.t1
MTSASSWVSRAGSAGGTMAPAGRLCGRRASQPRRGLAARVRSSPPRQSKMTPEEERFLQEQNQELRMMQQLSQEWWKFDSPDMDPEHIEERLQQESVDPETVAALVLGGGTGDGLFPLTERMAKGAVQIGGSYRLIDIPLSNCIASGIFKMYVFTQYNSSLLNNYIAHTYDFGYSFGKRGFVEVLTATITPDSTDWFGGTADAIRQYAWAVDTRRNRTVEDILILKTDHLYRMDYRELVLAHRISGADVTLCTYPVDEQAACKMALVQVDKHGRVKKFEDKPTARGYSYKAMGHAPGYRPPATRDATMLDKSLQVDGAAYGQPSHNGATYLASMGIYVFKKRVLFDMLSKKFPKATDFGADIFPKILEDHLVMSHTFRGYWSDVSTIKSFFEEQISLASEAFQFHDVMPRNSKPEYLPATRIERSKLNDAVINGGCVLMDCAITKSVIGDRVVAANCTIDNAIIMGADYYETWDQAAALTKAGKVPLGLGSGTVVKNAIISVNCRIGKNCVLTNEGGVQHADFSQSGFYVKDGIIVVMAGTTLPDGFVI